MRTLKWLNLQLLKFYNANYRLATSHHPHCKQQIIINHMWKHKISLIQHILTPCSFHHKFSQVTEWLQREMRILDLKRRMTHWRRILNNWRSKSLSIKKKRLLGLKNMRIRIKRSLELERKMMISRLKSPLLRIGLKRKLRVKCILKYLRVSQAGWWKCPKES